MANSGGVMYEDYKNVKSNTKVNSLGNEVSENLYINMKAGAWTLVRNIDFGEEGAKSFMLRVKGTGKMELRLTRTASAVATIEFSSTTLEDHTIELPDPSKFTGIKSIYFTLISGTNVCVDAWQFTEVGTDGIQALKADTQQPKANSQTYDLSGRRLSNAQQHRGIVIKNGRKVWH